MTEISNITVRKPRNPDILIMGQYLIRTDELALLLMLKKGYHVVEETEDSKLQIL